MGRTNFNKFDKVLSEFEFSKARSGGPGGQHVNKTETKVELRWKYLDSEVISQRDKDLISKKLESIINIKSEVFLSSSLTRSQKRNQEDCVKKLKDLLDKAFYKPPPRKRTRPSYSTKKKNRKRREALSEKKQNRKKIKL